jgi:hypothetical protein
MENETAEKVTPTEPTPAPATAVAENTTPVSTEGEKKVVPAEPQTPSPEDKEKARQAFQARQEKKEKKATERVAELENELKQLRDSAAKPKEPEVKAKPNLLDDPEGHEKWLLEQAEQRARNGFLEEAKAYEVQAKHYEDGNKAADFLLTRSHLKEDKALQEEVLKTIQEKYGHIGAIDGARDPMGAARLAYIDVCAQKGIVPDLPGFKGGGFNASGGASSIGARPSASGTAKRVWSKAEAEKYLMEAVRNPSDYAARSAEIKEARGEGRIK